MPRQRSDLSSTLEDYLETIYELIDSKGAARVRDIADALDVHKSTVTAALRTLADKKLINYSPYELTTLTPRGVTIARQVQRRHEILETFLRGVLLVEGDRAKRNACRMEHVVDSEVLDRLVLFARFVRECPTVGDTILEQFSHFVANQSDELVSDVTARGAECRRVGACEDGTA